MHAFHVFVIVLVSSCIYATQCGFTMFTKNAALVTFESLHLYKWAFDKEVVLLSDHQSIQIVEVYVPWHEVDGSKLNTSKWALVVVSINMLQHMICV
jgi:dolichyl-phosphate beta-glucosyltransferase